MPSTKRLSFYRLLERLIIMFIIGGTAVVSFIYQSDYFGQIEFMAAIVSVMLALLVLYLVQRTIDKWVAITLDQANFSQDGAFTALYDNSPVAYLTIDTSGKILGSNAAAVKLLHAQVNTIKSLNFYNSIAPSDVVDPAVLAGKIEAGVIINDIEIPLTTATGEIVWVMLSVFSYRSKTERVVALVDVTEQKHIDTAKSEFVALATHQLRTPIAAIRWNVELLRKNLLEVINPDRDRYLTKIERNVLRMIALINDFLSVSKLEMGTFASQPEDIGLKNFFDSILDEFAEKISEKNIQVIRNEVPPEAQIKTDSRLLHIIVSNLVSNAVKYLNSEGTLELSFLKQDGVLELIISDNGIGIPTEEVEKLFIKFYRASNAQSHQTEGTGLGLYIVKQSVELLGGTITVETAENKGTKFSVRLPVVE